MTRDNIQYICLQYTIQCLLDKNLVKNKICNSAPVQYRTKQVALN